LGKGEKKDEISMHNEIETKECIGNKKKMKKQDIGFLLVLFFCCNI